MNNNFLETFEYKVIYICSVDDPKHKDCLKIGDAVVHTDKNIEELTPNSKELNQAARKRIHEWSNTFGVNPDLLYTEIAAKKEGTHYIAFRDYQIQAVLKNSGIDNKKLANSREWFEIDLKTAIAAIKAFKNGYTNLSHTDIDSVEAPLVLRPEQEECVTTIVKHFNKSNRYLINGKMRFGKTIVGHEIIKRCNFEKTLILTHRPVVDEGWYEDFNKVFKGSNWIYGSKKKGNELKILLSKNKNAKKNIIYFASLQDLRGTDIVGGKFDKNDEVFNTEWDCLIIDEAHEGTTTNLGMSVIDAIISKNDNVKLLELSGTPFNILDNYTEENTYTWDYIMEQESKENWDILHPGDSNPYSELPAMKMFTYNLSDIYKNKYITLDDKCFNFKEFFRTYTELEKENNLIPKKFKVGDFVHEQDVNSLLDLLTTDSQESNYPYSNEKNRNLFKHTLWMVPGVKEAKALSKLLKKHKVFGCGLFNIVNVAGNGDEEESRDAALSKVKKAIKASNDDSYTITLSCGRLTTGVTVKEWTAVLMLSGSYNTSASSYMQTIFRVQSPCNINGGFKENCYVFDFAPDRTLKIVTEAVKVSTKAGKTSSNDRNVISKFLNYCPVIAINGSKFVDYSVDKLLQHLKKAYAERVVKHGFDDPKLYNDKLLKLDNVSLELFNELKGIIGTTQATPGVRDFPINEQGLTDGEIEITVKPKRELTEEELEQRRILNERRRQRDNAIKILRGISVRMPLLIYGADVKYDDDITLDKFIELVDKDSWEEFMPNGVTKDVFKKFKKYYDEDIFIASGRHIRTIARSSDSLDPLSRAKMISQLFGYFKNPDKETVLTPWNVVNMHFINNFGGWTFFDKDFKTMVDNPRFIDCGSVTDKLFKNNAVKILEINSKTGLYPLCAACSLYIENTKSLNSDDIGQCKKIWKKIIRENLFIICRTDMAKAITQRTLLGYETEKINAHTFDDIVNMLKNKSKQFEKRIFKFWFRKGTDMKFDAVVGNPPYQQTKGNTKNVDIWQYFVEEGCKISEYSSFIHPARWLVPKKQMKKNHDMILGNHLVKFDLYPNSNQLFGNSVGIDGGVTITFFDKNYKGPVKYYNEGKLIGDYDDSKLFFINKFEEEIFKSFVQKYNKSNIAHRVKGNIGSLGSSEYGYSKSQHLNLLKESNKNMKQPLKIWANSGHGKGSRFSWYYVDGLNINHVPEELLKTSKVMLDKKGHAILSGKGNVINNVPEIVGKNCIASGDVLFVLPEKDEKYHLDLIKSYFMTKTVRFAMTIIQKDLYVRGFENVPDYTNFIDDLNGKLFTDEYFYNKFKFSNELISHIETSVSSK